MTTATIAEHLWVNGAAAMRDMDSDALETQEWRDAFDSVLEFEGADRAQFILQQVLSQARRRGTSIPYSANTASLNTIPPELQTPHPGNQTIEHRIRSFVR